MSLRVYILTRLVTGIAMIFILLTFVFLILRVIPGDPVAMLLPPEASPEAIEALRKKLGLDAPIHIQYFRYMTSVLHGDLGRSLVTGRRVLYDISYALPTTIELTLGGMIVGLTLGISEGLLSALKRYTITDHLIRVKNLFFYAAPVFWVGPILQLLFAVYLGILPLGGRLDTALTPARITGLIVLDSILVGNPKMLINALLHLILPSVVLGLFVSGAIARMSRSEVINALSQEYILVAKAKGLSDWGVIHKHAFRNALLPIITIMGMQFAVTLGGAVLTETIFNLPGMGSLLIYGLSNRDYPVIQGVLVLSILWVSIATFVIDIAYRMIDPRLGHK